MRLVQQRACAVVLIDSQTVHDDQIAVGAGGPDGKVRLSRRTSGRDDRNHTALLNPAERPQIAFGDGVRTAQQRSVQIEKDRADILALFHGMSLRKANRAAPGIVCPSAALSEKLEIIVTESIGLCQKNYRTYLPYIASCSFLSW